MGTTYSVKYTGPLDAPKQQQLHTQIKSELAAINNSMSTYLADSEISRINQRKSQQPIEISAALATVLAEAANVADLSGGAFDITVGPLVNLWGFGPKTPLPPQKTPDANAITATKATTGMDKILLDLHNNRLIKQHPDVYLDLSAIAKGYAVDQLVKLVEAQQIKNYMVEIGGELRVRGTNAQGTPWRIAIEKPNPDSRTVFQVIELQDLAVATSGDYRHYFEINGVRYSHTINPRTGKPIDHKLASVTVLASECMRADALATALMVLGAEAGMQLAEQQQIPALFIVKTESDFAAKMSSKFNAYIGKANSNN